MPALTISMSIELVAEIERVIQPQGKPVSVFMQEAARKYLDEIKQQSPRSETTKTCQSKKAGA